MQDRALTSSQIRWLTLGFSLYAMSTMISMAVMSIGTAVLMVALLVGLGGPQGFRDRLKREFANTQVRSYFYLAGALALTCVASLITAWIWPLGYGGKFVEAQPIQDSAKLWYLFWPLLMLPGLRALPQERRSTVLRVWLLTFAALAAVGVLQYWTGWPRRQPIPGNEGHFHATLFLGHHLSVASILIFPFFAALDLIPNAKLSAWLRLPRPATLAAVLLGAGMLFFTYSRILWVALPLGLVLWAVLSLPRKHAILGLLLLAVGGALLTQHPAIRFRLTNELGHADRFALWSANWEFFRERPLLGVGFLQNGQLSGYYLLAKNPEAKSVFAGHAHNNLLNTLSGTGALGTAAWLAWSAFALALAWRAFRRNPSSHLAKGLFVAWIVFHLNGLTQANFWEGKVTHQFIWVLAWTLLWNTSLHREDSAS